MDPLGIQANPSSSVSYRTLVGGMDCLVGCRFDGRLAEELPRFWWMHTAYGRELDSNKLGVESKPRYMYITQMLHVWSIYLNVWLKFRISVGKHSLHGASGKYFIRPNNDALCEILSATTGVSDGI